jgi:hypothetical protein
MSEYKEPIEVNKCPKCGDPSYHARPCGGYSGGRSWVFVDVKCAKCGYRYTTAHKCEGKKESPDDFLGKINKFFLNHGVKKS